MKVYIECKNYDDKHSFFRLFGLVVPKVPLDFSYGGIGESSEQSTEDREVELLELDLSKASDKDIRRVGECVSYFTGYIEKDKEER
jgi:hypothetical protein